MLTAALTANMTQHLDSFSLFSLKPLCSPFPDTEDAHMSQNHISTEGVIPAVQIEIRAIYHHTDLTDTPPSQTRWD